MPPINDSSFFTARKDFLDVFNKASFVGLSLPLCKTHGKHKSFGREGILGRKILWRMKDDILSFFCPEPPTLKRRSNSYGSVQLFPKGKIIISFTQTLLYLFMNNKLSLLSFTSKLEHFLLICKEIYLSYFVDVGTVPHFLDQTEKKDLQLHPKSLIQILLKFQQKSSLSPSNALLSHCSRVTSQRFVWTRITTLIHLPAFTAVS
ncbi:hypothetical protein CDAR_304101 [Caerostris darwini]|uniref:Maturase K n=1 Tax=Caerostris darwini TaxID=1538125 RepID=A0AAV4W9W5_9ARAC|nr:hypothetical protein CDAR_304101 [Caerostris darwini]